MANDLHGALTRRRFLRWSQGMMAALGLAPVMGDAREALGATPAAHAVHGVDYYEKLGVTPIINAYDTVTNLTASVMPAEVQAAVALAAKKHVQLAELQRACGAYIAERLKCESALVSCGASSALSLATAACVQAANGCKPGDIPQLIGTAQFPKNEVIVQKSQRYEYEHAMYLAGVKIVEVATMDEYRRALNERTVMTNYLNKFGIIYKDQSIPAEDWIRVAHEHGVPCHCDAAADVPPISNLWKFTGMGFDLVCFSGGKGIRGPQNAGLLLGAKKYIDLAAANNNPGTGIGRGMKVAKEQLVGMVAAVDWILAQTDEGLDREYTRRCNVISGMVKDIPTMKASVMIPPAENQVPHLILTYDPAVVGVTPREVYMRLRTDTTPIFLSDYTGQAKNPQGLPSSVNTIIVETWMLEPGDEYIVGRRLHKALTDPKSVGTYTPRPARPA